MPIHLRRKNSKIFSRRQVLNLLYLVYQSLPFKMFMIWFLRSIQFFSLQDLLYKYYQIGDFLRMISPCVLNFGFHCGSRLFLNSIPAWIKMLFTVKAITNSSSMDATSAGLIWYLCFVVVFCTRHYRSQEFQETVMTEWFIRHELISHSI